MTSNDELLVFMKAHEQKIDKYFELTGQQFKLINERITELLETEDAILKQLVEPKPVKIAEDVDFEKTIRHASPGIEGTISEEAYQKAQKTKPKLEPLIHEIEYEGRKYERFMPCKYKCGYWTSWAMDYKKGDNQKLHINPNTKDIYGLQCPEWE